ncbi:hypothetical protein [Lactobacillus phage Semele]|uniref:Uncharacterized protein n=1 Tax=Lactobacillus phage Semele TaxID=2079433 RepID=A0A2K9VD55_9CAUD|nr:hypothetical protein HOS80_gp137 [Lactobacillus phage Semele]AUV60163.1 hypothetical protein [Lactobacillus phage Semele]
MKYSEAKKQIKALSSKYDIDMGDGDFNLVYKGRFVSHTYVIGRCRYTVVCDEAVFSKLPFSNKVYMILSELAMTPLDERVGEDKYYIHVFKGHNGYLNIFKDMVTLDDKAVFSSKVEANGCKTKFLNSEISQLKQRNDIPLDWKKVTLEEAD